MRRVVVTGIGLVTPLGTGKEKTWKALLNGECGIDKITAFDTTEHSVHIAAEVKDFVAEDFIEKKYADGMEKQNVDILVSIIRENNLYFTN